MAQNDNQQQENRAFKKEDAYETLGIINTWIGNMDTKVSFALALAGVLIGVIFEKGMPSAFERITEVSNWQNYLEEKLLQPFWLHCYIYQALFLFYVLCYLLLQE